jgi:hypothetical protein
MKNVWIMAGVLALLLSGCPSTDQRGGGATTPVPSATNTPGTGTTAP